jgi:hypothetical protein
MSISLVLENYDKLYEQILNKDDIIIVNDFSCVTEAEREQFNDRLRTSRTPAGALPRVWIRAPRDITAFINPFVWSHALCSLFDTSNFSVVQYLTDRTYTPGIVTDLQADVDSLQIPRGLNNFITNFGDIYDKLSAIVTDQKKSEQYHFIRNLWLQQGACFFPRYLPVPNYATLSPEKANGVHYVEKTAALMSDAIRILAGIDTPLCSLSEPHRENKTIRTVGMYAAANNLRMKEAA